MIGPVELNHLDRLLFGTSQYYLFVLPSKASAKDPYYTFEMMQDEIAKAAGMLSKDTKNMTSGIDLFCTYLSIFHFFINLVKF